MLEKLEEQYDVKVISTTECYFIDPHSPAFFKFRADMFVNAEFEYRVIRDRSKFGNWKARSAGRYITSAPLGYDNKRDQNNKPIIVPNIDADKVREAYRLYLEGFGFNEIKKATNIKRSGKSAIKRILTNPTYAGLIKVAAYREHPETIVEGIHQGLVSKDTFWRVQEKIKNGERPTKSTSSEDFPLRGYLQCADCQQMMTGARSKGKMGVYYYYYRCETCDRRNINARKVDGWVEDVLKNLSLSIPINYWNKYFMQSASKIIAEKKRNWKAAKKELDALERDIDKLESKFIKEEIDSTLYKKWKSRYETQRNQLQKAMADSKLNLTLDPKLIKSVLSRLTKLNDIYKTVDPAGKQQLLSLIMIGGLYSHKEYLQTPRLNQIFDSNNLEFNHLQIKKLDNIVSISDKIPTGTRSGT